MKKIQQTAIVASAIIAAALVFILLGQGASTGFAVVDTQAQQALQQIEQDITELEQVGLSTAYVTDLYEEAQRAFQGEDLQSLQIRAKFLNKTDPQTAQELFTLAEELAKGDSKVGEDYNKVLEIQQEVRAHKEQALALFDELHLAKAQIEAVNDSQVNLSNVWDIYLTEEENFYGDRFENISANLATIEEEIIQAQLEATRLRVLYKASQRTLKAFIARNWAFILLSLIILAAAAAIMNNEYIIKKLKKKQKENQQEERILQELRKKTQEEYYGKGTLSRRTYEARKKKYKERQLQIKEQAPVIASKLEKRRTSRKWYAKITKSFIKREKKS